jgi:hypothetical protein
MKLDDRELGTVLAALRYWQRGTMFDHNRFAPEWEIATDGQTIEALDVDEIDELCEKLNCED